MVSGWVAVNILTDVPMLIHSPLHIGFVAVIINSLGFHQKL